MGFRPLPSRDVRWAPVEGEGLEHLHLSATPSGVVARSAVIGERGGIAYGIFYEIHLDAGWRVERFEISTARGQRLALTQEATGRWTDESGAHRTALDGCIDIDLAGTPFTNTLPIRRLAGRLSQPADLRMLYVRFDTFEPLVDEQRYTELSPTLFRYEAMDRSFSVELPVDEDGLVIDYPTLFKRV
ncbi:putative glycolipid-binding domain-containing protein [Aureimonas sp. ME7]|uniref:putative glycolipid-binding domain-containing protein n=1 Tax=Aureimonas sp. ME7 TaxID=2744252 RepID=UPI0015F698C8|nr:putative glycolipid-binding domain-containing protein [Aureimonas sp. ME7]